MATYIRRLGTALAGAILLSALLPLPAFAAVAAKLSPSSASPGSRVVLTTVDVGNGSAYKATLARQKGQAVFLIATTRYRETSCGDPDSYLVGHLTWKGDVGVVTFTLPTMPYGSYYVFIQVDSQCWRVAEGNRDVPLVLTVTDEPLAVEPSVLPTGTRHEGNATGRIQSFTPYVGLALGLALAIALAVCGLVIVMVRRRGASVK